MSEVNCYALAGLLGAGTIGTASAIEGTGVVALTIRLAWLKCLTK